MGLRSGGEKPAAVLWLVYTCGWLPALGYAYFLRPGGGPAGVLTAAGETGVRAGLALGATLAILAAAYAAAIRCPPPQRVLLAAAGGSVLAALAMPLLFSADVFAYAYYGDLALHGRDPYGHDPAPAADPLAAAAVAAWNGHIPPRCVYGPAAVAIAALADVAGAPGGVAGQIVAQRLAAAAAFGVCVAAFLRLVPEPRARAVFALNPVVIWSVAEGHNDAAMLALVLAGFTARRGRPLLFALAALVKAPALLVWRHLAGAPAAIGAAVAVAAGYAPLAIAAAGAMFTPVPTGGNAAAWQSPLGLLAQAIGRLAAVAMALGALGALGFGARRLEPSERAPAFALAAWFALPNAYPWYALWFVPLAACTISSMWSRALIVAALFSPARAITDAVFRAPESFDGVALFHPAMIALEFLPPLVFLGFAGLRRRPALALILAAALVGGHPATVMAQSTAPSPQPAAPPATPGPATPSPTPTGPVTLPPTLAPMSPTPSPGASVPVPLPQVAPPTPPEPSPTPPPASVTPAPSAPAQAAPPPATPPPVSAPTPAPNPLHYIIDPAPVPVTMPDGPHILEVQLNERRIRAGGPLIVRVFTSANVVGVEARALGRFIPIPQSGQGLFALAYTMPDGIPFWLLNRNYDIVIAAATADGRQTSVSFPMLLTR